MKKLNHLTKPVITAFLLSILVTQFTYGQGVTTSSFSGIVLDEGGTSLVGANVVALHVPSGTIYGTSTDIEGNFRIPNMRVGGPYRVTTSYTGYGENVLEDVMLRLGEAQRRTIILEGQALELSGIEIVATAGATGQNAGASTQVSAEQLNILPTLDRDLNDFMRMTPQASTSVSGISFAGMNNRFNAMYIDGAVNNDVFGLSASGTNGGQTGISPISLDVIDQIQIVLSPYDVSLGGFAGGGINAVTKSGTNTLSATAYNYWQNEALAGRTNAKLTERTGSDRRKLNSFNERLYGFSLGGPIIKNKIFFFANAEFQNDETPAPFDVATYRGDSDASSLDALRDHVINNYGYNTGGYEDKNDRLKGVKLFGKLDFNIGENHKLTVRHQYTRAEQTDQNSSSGSSINFANNGVFFPSTTNSFAAELNSNFSISSSNNLIIGFTSVLDDRDPIGQDFPYVIIDDGPGAIFFGSEEFSTANLLDQKIFTVTDNFKLYRGDHTITFGTHNEFYDIYNLFIRQNYGSYDWDSVDDFTRGLPAVEYDRSYSLVDDITGDGSAAAGDFNAMQLGFYLQDEWIISPKFNISIGMRLDIPIITTDPVIDGSFNSTVLPVLQSAYSIANEVEGGRVPDGQIMLSPRLGYSYDITQDRKTIIRGGLGVFTSRIPFVWPGAMFSNNGLLIGGVDESDIDGDVDFISDPFNQYSNPDFEAPSGQLDLFVKNFKYPQVFRTNLAFDKTLQRGWQIGFECIYTKTLNNVVYTNINSDPTIEFTWSGIDNRPVFVGSNLVSDYSAIYVGHNTNDGYTYTLTGSVRREFEMGLDWMFAYTYGDAQAVNEGTSSQNSSQWRGQVSIDGRNNPILGRSDYALGSRIISALQYKLNWNPSGRNSTYFSLFYEGQSGAAFSYVIGARGGQNVNNETGSSSRNRSLPWIPVNQSEITFVETAGLSAEEQWELLDAFIRDDEHLEASRNGYADKNGSTAPFVSRLDLAIRQDLGLTLGGTTHRIQISLDIFNVANFLNKNWGAVYDVVGDFNNADLYQFEGYTGETPSYSFTNDRLGKEKYDVSDFSSRWRMRLGVRYLLN